MEIMLIRNSPLGTVCIYPVFCQPVFPFCVLEVRTWLYKYSSVINNMSEHEVLEKDKCEHPECTYSTSESVNCSNVNGNFRCEKLRRIFRQCPNKPRTEVFRSRKSDEGSDEMLGEAESAGRELMEGLLPPGFGRIFGRGDRGDEAGGGFFGGGMSPFRMFEEFERAISGQMEEHRKRGGGHDGGEEREYQRGFHVRPPHATQGAEGNANRAKVPPTHYRQYEKGATEL